MTPAFDLFYWASFFVCCCFVGSSDWLSSWCHVSFKQLHLVQNKTGESELESHRQWSWRTSVKIIIHSKCNTWLQRERESGQKRRRNVSLGERKNESNELIYNQSVSLFGEIHALPSTGFDKYAFQSSIITKSVEGRYVSAGRGRHKGYSNCMKAQNVPFPQTLLKLSYKIHTRF